jgi:hypothetical protein
MPESAEPSPGAYRRETILLAATWLALAVVAVLLARQNLSIPSHRRRVARVRPDFLLYLNPAIVGAVLELQSNAAAATRRPELHLSRASTGIQRTEI